MEIERIIQQMLVVFQEIGICIYEDEYEEELEINSLQFISIIVAIEDTFDILIEDDNLIAPDYLTFSWFVNIVNETINK